jgi:S1-C subfamily serine protease
LWIWVLFVTIIGFAAQCKSTAAAEKTKGDNMNLIKVAKEIRGEIVQIVVPLQDNNNSVGSGFWVDQRGYIATCWHVVSGNPTATLKVQSAIDPLFDLKSNIIISANWEVFSAKVIAKDEINDLALLKIDGNPFLPRKSIPTIGHKTLNAHYKESALKTELPEPGQKIFLAGYPFRTIISSGTRRDGCLHRSRPS